MSNKQIYQNEALDLLNYIKGANSSKQEFEKKASEEFKERGYFFIEGHPVDLNKLERAFEQMHEFFGLPLEVKRNYAGYLENTQQKFEIWDTTNELLADNIQDNWPLMVSGIQKTQTELFGAFQMCASFIIKALGPHLKISNEAILGMLKGGNHILRTIANSKKLKLKDIPKEEFQKLDERCLLSIRPYQGKLLVSSGNLLGKDNSDVVQKDEELVSIFYLMPDSEFKLLN